MYSIFEYVMFDYKINKLEEKDMSVTRKSLHSENLETYWANYLEQLSKKVFKGVNSCRREIGIAKLTLLINHNL